MVIVPNLGSTRRFVFVYGTLRRGECRDINHMRPAASWVADTRVRGRLYDLGEYPGLVFTRDSAGLATDWVQGEIYAVTPELEHQLDLIEGLVARQDPEYAKREIGLFLTALPGAQKPSVTLPCFLYEVMPRHAKGGVFIHSGDWVAYRKQLAAGATLP